MDFSKTSQPRFHQAAMATAFTLSIVSPLTSWAALCDTPANPFVVNITTNSDDPCDDQISLQEAVSYANDHLGHDTITFAPALNGQRIAAPEATIRIRESLSIIGPQEPDLITLTLSENNPLFDIFGPDKKIDFHLSNAVLENKESAINTNSYIIKMPRGKGRDGGDIVLDNIHTTANTQTSGIFAGRSYEDTLNITLKNSSISGSVFKEAIISMYNQGSDILFENNTVSPVEAGAFIDNESNADSTMLIHKTNIEGGKWNGGGKGSGIINAHSRENLKITVTESKFQNIESMPLSIISVGARSIDATNNSLVNIQDSLFSHNNTQPTYNPQITLLSEGVDVSIKNSVISDSHTLPIAVEEASELLIENTTIAGNSSVMNSSGIEAINFDDVTNVKILNSTLSGNRSEDVNTHYSGNMDGGVIYLRSIIRGSFNLSIDNSTITANSTLGNGGGIWQEGDLSTSTFNIRNSIVAGNISPLAGDHDLFGQFNVENSIIGDTTTTDSTTTINGTVIDQVGNSEGQTADTGNNLLGVDPLLQELGLSGGVWVHQLNAESPAIGAGNADAENLAEFDQRGEGFKRVRTVNGTAQLDIGAVQYFAKPVAVNDVVSVEQNSEKNVFEVLANDAQNSDGLALDVGSIVIMNHPEHGDAFTQPDGKVVYTPNPEFAGDDSFTYVVQDIDANTSSEATVSISVTELVIPTPEVQPTPEEPTPEEQPIPEELAPEPKEEKSKSGSSGGTFNLWFLSILGLIGLRRRIH